eukprot:TRINITY_DN51716_c0_g1_i1.p1 TRINITY_DN51716_c0_g1~~TRINITY_DN51716_c0_g1_i1.p1  ORF type:complete len:345 (+),score=120.50 TRINITY_DN51716_c0_g1_i1:98-1036(+)
MAGYGDGRESAYATPDPCADTLDVMNKRLSQDLRHRVRRMEIAPPLSPDWMDMAEIVSHLGQVAAIEAKGVQSRDQSTAWERDEFCVRFIIEEGKTNLMLRAIVQFKEWYYEAVGKGKTFDDDQVHRIRMFETGLSTLLRHSLGAVEALQTIDMTLLLEHVQRVLEFATDPEEQWTPLPGSSLQGCQETAVIGYLHAILRQADKLADEDKVLCEILDRRIVPMVLEHYSMYRGLEGMGQDLVEDYVWFLSYLMDTEHWGAHRKEYLADAQAKRNLAKLEDPAKAVKAAEQGGGDPERRKKVRALCDMIIRVK